MPAWKPRSETADTPSSLSAIDISGAETPSPVDSSRSNSRAAGSLATRDASVSSRSVVSPIALTTATTSLPARWVVAMRRAARLMRAGVASDVPPYFWTTIGLATVSGRAANVSLAGQPFRQQDGPLAGAEPGVVREDYVLDAFEDRLVPQTADGHRHAIARVAIAARLRTEGIVIDDQEALRGRG